MRIRLGTALAALGVGATFLAALAAVLLWNQLQQSDAALATANGKIDGLTDDLAESDAAVLAASERIVGLSRDLADSDAALATANGKIDGLTDDLAESELAHEQLRKEAGTVESLRTVAGSLRASINELRDEIAELEARRRPLILNPSDTLTNGFACTGSMEPAITCLDTATWLYDFAPEDVVVGAVIQFHVQHCPSLQNNDSSIAHRVMEIKTIDGEQHYWPKGDNVPEADGCWVPHSGVDAYIIEIHKDTRPWNATLRNKVNQAKADYDAARESYSDVRVRHGCAADLSARCSVPEGLAFDAVLTAFREVDVSLRLYNCMLDNARASGDGLSLVPTRPCERYAVNYKRCLEEETGPARNLCHSVWR